MVNSVGESGDPRFPNAFQGVSFSIPLTQRRTGVELENAGKNMGRRGFLGWVVLGSLSAAGILAAKVAGSFLYPVPGKKRPSVFVCFESELAKSNLKSITDLSGRTVLLTRKSDGSVTAMGTVCPHLGCTVIYHPEGDLFECPCHAGFFDAAGNPVSGPPDSPLDRYDVELRDGMVFVDFEGSRT